MALHLKTDDPKKLLAALKKAIDDGRMTIWSYDKDGDFTLTSDRWVRQAWMRPRIVDDNRLSLFILAPKETQISTAAYAVYHARFLQVALWHCDELFEEAQVTALPEAEDMSG